MEVRQEGRQHQVQTRQNTSAIERLTDQQQKTAIILERVAGRLEALERWQEQGERLRERDDDRRDEAVEKQPDQQRANLALLFSALTGMIYLLTFLSQHWR